MSSVTKPLSATASPVQSTRPGSSARAVASQYGSVSEIYAQAGVKGEDERPGYEDFNHNQGNQQQTREQPQTLKLLGTSRTFAMLYEEANSENGYTSSAQGEDGQFVSGRPAFQAYMNMATSTYDRSTSAVNGEYRNLGKSLNLAM